jgi:hypothetical protein
VLLFSPVILHLRRKTMSLFGYWPPSSRLTGLTGRSILEVIRERAYFIWHGEGCKHSRDLDHWTMALYALTAELAYSFWTREGKPCGRELTHWFRAVRQIEIAMLADGLWASNGCQRGWQTSAWTKAETASKG